jgi:hypothetical protein
LYIKRGIRSHGAEGGGQQSHSRQEGIEFHGNFLWDKSARSHRHASLAKHAVPATRLKPSDGWG